MIHTFDFLQVLRKDESERRKVYALINANQKSIYDIGSCRLKFDKERNVMIVMDNGADELLSPKIIPVEIPFPALKHLVERSQESMYDTDFGIRFL